jgi:hypothetical protein
MTAIETRTHAEILRAAATLIEEQGHFVMGVWAWNRQGQEIEPTSPDAWRWSARGAIYAVSGRRPLPFKELARDWAPYRCLDLAALAICKAQGWFFPNGTNVDDNLGHALTLQALEDAAVLAESDDAAPSGRAAEAGG